LGEVATRRTLQRKLFAEAAFHSAPAPAPSRCPAGHRLKPQSWHPHRQSIDSAAPKKVWAPGSLREPCPQNKTGRTRKRHRRQEVLDKRRQARGGAAAQRDLRIRPHRMERSFARATPYGCDPARWRGLWPVRIQEYLICARQNIEVLRRYGGTPPPKAMVVVEQGEQGHAPSALSGLLSKTAHPSSRTGHHRGARGSRLFFRHPDDLFGPQPVES
jgi:hypothetical protein